MDGAWIIRMVRVWWAAMAWTRTDRLASSSVRMVTECMLWTIQDSRLGVIRLRPEHPVQCPAVRKGGLVVPYLCAIQVPLCHLSLNPPCPYMSSVSLCVMSASVSCATRHDMFYDSL